MACLDIVSGMKHEVLLRCRVAHDVDLRLAGLYISLAYNNLKWVRHRLDELESVHGTIYDGIVLVLHSINRSINSRIGILYEYISEKSAYICSQICD